jgi:hypothetical protein
VVVAFLWHALSWKDQDRKYHLLFVVLYLCVYKPEIFWKFLSVGLKRPKSFKRNLRIPNGIQSLKSSIQRNSVSFVIKNGLKNQVLSILMGAVVARV